ncbi:MAG: hypothetical protein V4671_19130 [Armatimonadota bacterium]
MSPTYTPDWSDLEVNYSLTNRYSVGAANMYRQGKDSSADFAVGEFNYLVSRWNELDSQANIYASAGAGGRQDSRDDESLAGYLRLEGDYETRRVYTLFGAESLQSPGSVDFNRLRYRAGVAPYLAPFTSLQTWVIAQVDYMPEMEDEVEVTPLLRFFYNNYALELGVSLNGKAFLGAMAHF